MTTEISCGFGIVTALKEWFAFISIKVGYGVLAPTSMLHGWMDVVTSNYSRT
jgi:hypothetical protein